MSQKFWVIIDVFVSFGVIVILLVLKYYKKVENGDFLSVFRRSSSY